MNGSAKQIKWAEDLKANFERLTPDMSANPVADKAKQYLIGIDNAAFWIDYAQNLSTANDCIGLLRIFITNGIRLKGLEHDAVARMDQKTGEITITDNDTTTTL